MLRKKIVVAIGIGLVSGCAQQLPSKNTNQPIRQQADSVQPEITAVINDKKLIKAPPTTSIKIQPKLNATESNHLLPRIQQGFQFTRDYSVPRYQDQLKWYAAHQTYFDTVLQRSSMYLYHIVDQIEAKGLPTELALLPIVESAYDPFAYSHSHAAGLWQFIPGTGKYLGLKKNWWYEGRRDIVESTAAALKYLDYLNKRFDGDWLLALAAYNGGEGTVSRAIRRNKKAGKATDFWSLDLPKETTAYVPQLLAISSIVQNPQQYGITLIDIPNTPYFEEVHCDAQLDLTQAAKMASIPVEELYRLNPALNRWTTPPGSGHKLLVPRHCVKKFKTTLANTPQQQWVTSREYLVKAGDNLGKIALDNNVSVTNLRRENRLKSNTIRIGQILKIPGTGINSPIGGKNSDYEIRHGDSLWKIARAHNVRVKDLLAWNNLSPKDKIQPGQKMQILSKKSTPTKRKMRYQVKNGDSLGAIANKFNLLIKDIASWNKLNTSKYIQPGQKLTLYIDTQKL